MKLKRIITGVLASIMCVGAFNVTSAFASDETNIFIVGDSTSCIYGYDDNYALPRAGWGMYLGDFIRITHSRFTAGPASTAAMYPG